MARSNGAGTSFAWWIRAASFPTTRISYRAEIFRQAKVAFEEAAAIVMVVDARTEIAGPDRELARLLARTGKPLFLAVNKMDSDKQDSLLGEFHSLGMRNVFPVSAEHGRGIDDLLDAILLVLPASAKATTEDTEVTEEGTEEGSANSRRAA